MTRYFCFAASCLSLTSCLSSGDSVCSTNTIVPAVAVSGPKTVTVNQPAVYTIDYELGACGSFINLAEQVLGNSHLVGVNVQYNGCNCPNTVTQEQATYTFKPTQPGTYYLQFAANNGNIKDTLVVN